MAARILILDDEPLLGDGLRRTLDSHDLPADYVADPEAALARLTRHPYEALLTDFRMPGLDGLEVLRRAQDIRPECEVVLMTGHASIDLVRRALLRGAADFVTKPFAPEADVVPVLRRLLAPSVDAQTGPPSLLAGSPSLAATLRRARKVARSTASVLITGESGTGKELLARLIHDSSPRASRPFVVVDCAALPAALLEGELFGHRRGAFTGASEDRAGLFEVADRGTLLLDELGELAPELQPKLLRALQEGEVRRLGDTAPRALDVRVLAATHRDLQARVASGAFRADLYYRLAVVPLELPPLRERREDIPGLVRQLCGSHASGHRVEIQRDALARLVRHAWPGNVRELANAIEHALVVGDGRRLRVRDLPESLRESPVAPELGLRELEIRSILDALSRTGFNRTRAAQRLGITRRTLGYRIRKHGLEARIEAARRMDLPREPPVV